MKQKRTHESITCTTPPATSTFGVTTLALLTNTFPSTTVIVTLPPPSVGSVVLDNKLLYPTVPFTTWYVRIFDSCSVLNVDSAEPIASNAELEGAKIVTSRSESTALTRLADVRAPAREVRFAATAVEETGSGIVRTRSIM
jgi:hypothetical protein